MDSIKVWLNTIIHYPWLQRLLNNSRHLKFSTYFLPLAPHVGPMSTASCHVGFFCTQSVFQSLINNVLRHMSGKFIIYYIDDILICSPSCKTHILHVRQVLQHLTQNQLFIKGEKCAFHQCTIFFLGYIISPDGVSMDPAKISAMTEWLTSRNIKELVIPGLCQLFCVSFWVSAL